MTHTQQVRVLSPDRLVFAMTENPSCDVQKSASGLIAIPASGDPATFILAASAQDERGNQNPSPYSVSHINWSTANGKVLFDSGAGPQSTATGVLSLTVQCNQKGDDVITLTRRTAGLRF